MTRQCVILAGGLGTRLGNLTKNCPKPMLEVGGQPFIGYLVAEAVRFGFNSIVILAGYLGDQIAKYAQEILVTRHPGANISVLMEPEQLGTGGAIRYALPALEDDFVLINGDSWFDFNWLVLLPFARHSKEIDIVLSLRHVDDTSRYGSVETDGTIVTRFMERGENLAGTVNGGVYFVRRSFVESFPHRCSLERDILPKCAELGRVAGITRKGYFLDIGVPSDYERAEVEIPDKLCRPAVFLDRDDVLNVDSGYTHKLEDLRFVEGATEAVRLFNELGFYVFVVTNQAGVAKGIYTESALRSFHDEMQSQLRHHGAHIDDWRYCPYSPDGILQEYKRAHEWRKPAPGMLIDLMANWPIDISQSFLIGDRSTDIQAAEAAGIVGHLFEGGSLFQFASDILGKDKKSSDD